MLQNHLHIVQALRWRRTENNIVSSRDILFDLIIGQHLAAEFVCVTLQARFIDIKRGNDLSAELNDCAAMGFGDIAGADH